MKDCDFKVVIPARYESQRFPGKPLADILGKPMLQRVYECALQSAASAVVIATDSPRIGMAAEAFGATVCMTRSDHESGTDRIGEVVEKMGWDDDAIVVNLQGDEPLTPAAIIDQVATDLFASEEAACATLCTRLDDAEQAEDPNIVKLVFDHDGYAMYFSRAAIPFRRDASSSTLAYFRHIGMYAYRASLLRQYSALPVSTLEQQEKLEQLRLLQNGYRIHVAEACCLPGPGVDTAEDLQVVISQIEAASR